MNYTENRYLVLDFPMMEEFIDMVRQLPCIWDTECREYRDIRKKDAAWKRIVAELKCKEIPDSKFITELYHLTY